MLDLFGLQMPFEVSLEVRLFFAFIIVLGLLGLIGIGFRAVWKSVGKYTPLAPAVEIARITEHVVFSGGGMFAVLMLILFNIGLTITYVAATNILQQNVAMLSWIGWNILWGIGAIIGRRRTYVVHRNVHPERQEPRF